MSENNALPELSAVEIRVLGSLIEKSRTTPDYYPLTLNGLITACNQKSSRHPVMNLEQHEVLEALDHLKKIGLSANVLGDGRSVKYRHTLAVKYPLDPSEITVLGLLFLRGPLTVGELKNNAGRMYDFEDLNEVQGILDRFASQDAPFVKQLEKRPGQKEARYVHLFAEFDEAQDSHEYASGNESNEALSHRVAELENRVAALENKLRELFE